MVIDDAKKNGGVIKKEFVHPKNEESLSGLVRDDFRKKRMRLQNFWWMYLVGQEEEEEEE